MIVKGRSFDCSTNSPRTKLVRTKWNVFLEFSWILPIMNIAVPNLTCFLKKSSFYEDTCYWGFTVISLTSNLTCRVEFFIILGISFCSERSRTSLVRQWFWFFFSDGVTFTSNYREEAEPDTTNNSTNQYTSARGVY